MYIYLVHKDTILKIVKCLDEIDIWHQSNNHSKIRTRIQDVYIVHSESMNANPQGYSFLS